MAETECRAQYQRPGGRQPGDRIVHCHLPAGHPGEHEEADTEVTWESPTPTVAEPTSGPRAAQIQAALDVLRRHDVECACRPTQLAAQLVDAVHAAGRDDQGDALADLAEERLTTMARRAWRAEEALNAARAEVEQLRYERRLLGVARMTLDLVAAGDPTRWDHARAQAEDVAQRIVDEIGHPVTDEPALGPELRAQLADANERADQGEARGWAKAVQALRDGERYEHWWIYGGAGERHGDSIRLRCADYLEAVGPDGTAQLAPDHGTATPEDHALVARATGGRITSGEIQPEYDDNPVTAAETGQAGDAVADALLAVQQKLAGIHYHWSGGLPFVGREAIFCAVNDVAREALGESWYQVLGEALKRRQEAAETGQDGAGVDAGCGEAETGAGETRG